MLLMLFSTSNTGPVLEHMVTSLTSLFPTIQALSTLLSSGSNQRAYQSPSVEYFLLADPELFFVIPDSLQSYSDALPYFNSHFVGTASHDSTIPQGNVQNSPYRWCSG